MGLSGIPEPPLADIADGKCLPFVGAGFSLNADVPGDGQRLDWKGLAQRLAEVAGVSSRQSEPAIAAEYERRFGRVQLIDAVRDLLLHGSVAPGDAHREFAELPFDTIYTTNFDLLLEDSYASVPKPYRSLVGELQLPFHGGPKVVNVVKMHGDLNHEEHIVVTTEDYGKFVESHPVVATHLSAMLITRTALFVGYRLADPDFQQIRHVVRERLGKFHRMSYVLQFDQAEDVVDEQLKDYLHVVNVERRDGETRGAALARCFRSIQNELDVRAGARQRREMPTVFEDVPMGGVLEASRSVHASLLLSSSSNLCFVAANREEVGGPVFLELIEPSVRAIGLEVIRVDQLGAGGSLMEEIRSAIRQCRLCIVVYSGAGSAVEYELGLAQSLGKPLVVLSREGRRLPPSLQAVNVVEYPSGGIVGGEARDALQRAIETSLGEGRLEEAERLIDSGSIRAGVALLGMVLEHHVRRLLADQDLTNGSGGGRHGREVSLGRGLRLLKESKCMDKAEYQKLLEAVKVRNSAVHESREPDSREGRMVLDAVREFVAGGRHSNRTAGGIREGKRPQAKTGLRGDL